MTTGAILILALLLDAAFGEPGWLWRRVPHPAVLMGRLIGWADRTCNRGAAQRAKGVGVVLGLVLSAAFVGALFSAFGPFIEIVIAAILLAQRSLVQHVKTVADGLRMSTAQGRRAVAMIVSRDTGQMPPSAIARSAIESAAENLSDGVIAPAFWFLIAGLPGLLVYKITNTADSMIGYRTERHAEFGWAAARFDDLLNWVPARITAFLIALPGGVLNTWPQIRADAALHRSPNAGWPEAAMARVLDVALAGPRAYDGQMQDFPFVHPTGKRDIGPVAIDAAVTNLWKAWGVMILIVLILDLTIF